MSILVCLGLFLIICVGWNFVAALLLQGSVQVYSKKVEYLYSLVLHALDFISKKRFGFLFYFLSLYLGYSLMVLYLHLSFIQFVLWCFTWKDYR